MKRYIYSLLFALLLGCEVASAADKFPFDAIDITAELRNPWPDDWEQQFRKRGRHSLEVIGAQKAGGGTYGENEKNYYPRLMVQMLSGDRAAALKGLQAADAGAREDMQHTLGIDYYWCFTLKGQMRKYFLFGDQLDPEYRQRMYDGAKIWTEQEPLHRPHPVYGKGRGNPQGEDWSPAAKGGWVDARGTDNLRAMRDTAVYLMAEETKNEATRQLYKRKLIANVRMLYYVGQSEWDSENYHGHALSPYHNLYDFAKDPEVKLLAKAALDWLYTAAAVKYYRGGFGGPNCRDYGGGNVVFGANVSHPLWLYFGDTPTDDPMCDRDDVYHITSPYRPPAAVVALARKQFERPVEMFAAKPPYEFWEPGKFDQPRYHETQHFGHTYQLGSLVSAKPEATWNVSPLKMMIANKVRGVDYFVVNTHPIGEHARKNAGDQIAQAGNELIWLRPSDPQQTFYFLCPRSAKVSTEGELWLVEYEQTWIALRPIHLSAPKEIAWPEKAAAKYGNDRMLAAEPEGGPYCGFVIEVGEVGAFPNAKAFLTAINTKSSLDVDKLAAGFVQYWGTGGQKLAMQFNAENDLPHVYRDDVEVDWSQRRALYHSQGKSKPVSLDWQDGTLRVAAGGHAFECRVTKDGKVTFSNRLAK